MTPAQHEHGARLVLERYLRALWGGAFEVRFAPVTAQRSAFDARALLLPRGFGAEPTSTELELARARAAHAAAHAAFSGPRFEVGSLKPLQRVLVSLFEDARVEALAMRRFPGLRQLWAPFHRTSVTPFAQSAALFARLARALFDPSYSDPESWIQKARDAFWKLDCETAGSSSSRRLGNHLGNDLGQMRLAFAPREYVVEPVYRDDHSGLWEEPPVAAHGVSDAPSQTANESEPAPASPSTHAYPEWDYVIARERPAFCEVREQHAVCCASFARARPATTAAAQRLRASLRRALVVPSRQQRVHEGPVLDLAAAVDAVAELRAGQSSARAVFRREKRGSARVSALLLLDLSESSNALLADGHRGRELASACAELLCSAAPATLELAIDAFSSHGRKDVRYRRLKDFTEPAAAALARFSELGAAGSTRLGAALRHSSERLRARAAADKLLLVVTDADPADIDVYDDRYLVEDARAAVIAARRAGILVFACCLPGGSARVQRRIFGRQRAPLARVGDLPARLHAAFSARRRRS
jgi:nitric oxide reductase NorD protein